MMGKISKLINRRLLLLGTPLFAVAAILLLANNYHPDVFGSLVLQSANKIKITFTKPINLPNLRHSSDIVLRSTFVNLNADKIVIEGYPHAYSHLVITPEADMTLSFISKDNENHIPEIKLGLDSSQSMTLTHNKVSDDPVYYIDLYAETSIRGKILFGNKQRITIGLSNCIITASREGTTDTIYCKSNISMTLKNTNTAASLIFLTHPKIGFLSIGYYLNSNTKTSPVVLYDNANEIALADEMQTDVRGVTALYIDGEKEKELFDVKINVKGTGMKLTKPVEADNSGLNVAFNGYFENISTRYSNTRILPSLLTSVSSFVAILFGVFAYLIDKIVTVDNFVKEDENKSGRNARR